MANLNEDDINKALDSKDLIPATLMVEKVYGTVGCDNCEYWGRMDGYIEPDDKRFIKFICPKCNVIEPVKNPEHRS